METEFLQIAAQNNALRTNYVCYVPLSGQTNDNTEYIYITIYIYFLDGRLCEVGAVRRGIRIVRLWGLNSLM